MNQDDIIMDTHTLLFPYSIVVFGQAFPMPCEATFRHSEDNEGNVRLAIDSLTATDEKGTIYNMEHLVADELSEMSSFVMSNIIMNTGHWDWEPLEGSETTVWW